MTRLRRWLVVGMMGIGLMSCAGEGLYLAGEAMQGFAAGAQQAQWQRYQWERAQADLQAIREMSRPQPAPPMFVCCW